MDSKAARILVVDDDAANREMLCEVLGARELDAHGAADGAAALACVESESFDLILLDVTMPGLSGFDVLRRIREEHPPTRLPVIMITGLNQGDHVVEALRMGANDYITKPFDLSIVLARIRTQLALKGNVDQIIELKHDLARKNCELEQAYTQIKTDLQSAARVQRALLPSDLPQVDQFNFAWAYRPCDDLAGDSLNVFQLDDEHVGMYLLDVSGHGVRAALLSVSISRILAPIPGRPSIVQQQLNGSLTPTPPAVVAEELNRRFQLDPETYQFFTIFYGVLNVRSRELRYLCAGQAGPIYAPCGREPVALHDPSIAIGLVPSPEYSDRRMTLAAGDRLYLYSDGIDEARNSEQELFGTERVVRAVGAVRDRPLDESLNELVRTAEIWSGRPFEDDVSAIALETC